MVAFKTLQIKESYDLILIDLSKKQAHDVDRKAIQQISFTVSLDRVDNTGIFLIVEEAKETFLDFSRRTARIL